MLEKVKRDGPGILADEVAHQIIGAAIDVHRALGPGYLEAVYEEALAVELTMRGIPYLRQHAFSLTYKGRTVGEGRIDLLIADQVVVELKAVHEIAPIHYAQMLSYLKATQYRLADC